MDYKDNWTDIFGRIIFYHRTDKNLFAHRAYHWCDRIIVNHESDEGGRRVISDNKFSTFDLSDWHIMDKELDKLVKNNYSEIYDIWVNIPIPNQT